LILFKQLLQRFIFTFTGLILILIELNQVQAQAVNLDSNNKNEKNQQSNQHSIVRTVELSEEESKFVTDLNTYRARFGEGPIDYTAIEYEAPEDKDNSLRRLLVTKGINADRHSVVSTLPHLFVRRLYELVNKRPVVLELFVGFSAAGYDESVIAEDLKAYTEMTVAKNKAKYGPNTVTIFLAGGTSEGIGRIYSPDITAPDLLKVGIVADQALAYEIKYGNQLAPKLDGLLLVNSFTTDKEKKIKSWEVKSRQGDASNNNSIHDLLSYEDAKWSVFEGGDIGLKETLEWLENRSSASFAHRKFELNLMIGYRPSVAKKDKGFRASAQIAQLLLRYPELIPPNVEVNIYKAGKVASLGAIKFEQFRLSNTAKKLLAKSGEWYANEVEMYKQKLISKKEANPEWYAQNQATVDAELLELESWFKIDAIAAKVLSEAQTRNKNSLDHWDRIVKGIGPLHPDDLADHKSGVAQQSYDLLKKKMVINENIINALKGSHSIINKCINIF